MNPYKIWKCSDFLKFFTTNSLSWDQLSYTEQNEFLNLHYGLIHNGSPTLIDCEKYQLPYIQINIKNYTLCDDGDVIFADASEDTKDICKPVEFINISKNNVVCGLHTIHARDYQNLTILGYKGYLFSSYNFHKQVHRLTQGTKIFSINSSNFKEMFVGIPEKAEQKEIVLFLAKIDERIDTQSKIIEDYSSLKKSIIDNFFNELTNSSLGEHIIEITERNGYKNEYEVLSVSNKYGFIKQNEQFEDRIIASENKSNYKVVRKNTFAYNPTRINVGSIACMHYLDIGIVSPMYLCFSTLKTLSPYYLEYYFLSKSFKLEMNKKLEGSVRMCLQIDALKKIKLYIPSLEIQNKFVNKLSCFDKKIQKEKDILSLYKKQKAYLLQNMFI